MGGFNYGGGKGDGTGWSSERGSTPEPGGGSKGNGGATHHRVVLGLAADGLKRGPLVQH